MISPLKRNDFAIMIITVIVFLHDKEEKQKSAYFLFCGVFYYISFKFCIKEKR